MRTWNRASELVEWTSLAGKITIPMKVQSLLIGSQTGDEKARKRFDFMSLRIFQQSWENLSLLEDEFIKSVFDQWKTAICDAISSSNPYVFKHMAEAVEDAANRDRKSIGRLEAIALAFVNLRYRYKNGEVPRTELERESRHQWAFWDLVRRKRSFAGGRPS